MPKKFFLISQVFYPDEVSTAGLFTNLCSVIAEGGYEVIVWCAHPSYSARNRQPKKAVYKGIKIFYLPSTNFHKDNILGRFANMFTFSISVLFKLLFSKEREPVFTHTTPPPLGIIVSFVCAMRKRKFCYILLDIFPEGLIRLGKVSRNNLLIRFWNFLFVTSLKKSNRIIVLGRDMKAWIEKINSGIAQKTDYIPHWQDDNIFFPSEFRNNEFVKSYNLEKKFVVQYSGNMGLWNEMETFGKAVQTNLEGVLFMFVGGGVRKNELIRSFQSSDLQNTLFLPFQQVPNPRDISESFFQF